MIKIGKLTCESLENPIGLYTMHPGFSWQLESDKNSVTQEQYQVEVVNSSGKVVWDSGKIQSCKSVFVEYAGPALEYATLYKWRVRVWVNAESSDWSEYAWFETAIGEWKAPFICADDTPESSEGKLLQRKFTLSKHVEQARIYATALGLYEICLNGKPVTDACFTPGWTAYDSRLLYQTMDITELLTAGEQTVTVSLGPGWYKGEFGFIPMRNIYGEKMAFSARIDLLYEDGERQTIFTDIDWQYADSPIVFSEIYHGEIYDARKECPTEWSPVKIYQTPDISISPFDGIPVKRHEVFKPVDFFATPKGERVLDFGQNMAGRVRFRVSGNRGDRVRLRHAEVLDSDGNFYTENLRSAKCTIEYICKGDTMECYEPIFTFQGFRYVCVDEYPGELDKDLFEAVAIYSDMEKTGSFLCSEPLINQLQSNITWSLKGNFLDIPTDCPQRDERLGWTGDAQIFIPTASYLYNVLPFFRKWLRDLSADQTSEGGVPFVVPNILKFLKGDSNFGDSHSACGWSDAAVIIPWEMYEAYGDRRILEEQYPSMKAWVEYVRSKAQNNLWDTGFQFGDWVALDAKEGSYHGATPNDLCATAYYARSAELLAKTAEVLGKTDDAAAYLKLHGEIVQAFQDEFYTSRGRLAARTQTAHILTLVFGLAPEAHKQRTVNTLLELIKENDGHLVTGFLGTPYFCHALSQNGELKAAYDLLQREAYPSWLYQVKMGATTVWEHLDGIKPDGSMWSPDMNSFNHYAYGAVGDWLYKVVSGINPLECGYRRVLIAPKPGGTLTWAEASLETPYGKLKSRWDIREDKMHLEVHIPVNTCAVIELPDGAKHEVGSGYYEYVCVNICN